MTFLTKAHRMKVARALATAGISVVMMTAHARPQEVVWDLINEYPATSPPGEADALFAAGVKRSTNGRVVIRALADAKSGLRSREQLGAVREGRFAMADSFGGALADESPVFLLSSLPFVTPSANHARALYEAARPIYERLFFELRQKLLYVAAWPPSGIWSTIALRSIEALKSLKIRTYDQTGAAVFGQVTAGARTISFSDLDAKLEAGEINAVLSSGDGGAGRQLWKHLRNFSNVSYAVPVSFAAVSLDQWAALDATTRAAIEEAGNATTEHQWIALTERIVQHFARMRRNGVTIDENPPDDVMAALRAAAAKSVAEWQGRVGAEAARVLDDYRDRTLR